MCKIQGQHSQPPFPLTGQGSGLLAGEASWTPVLRSRFFFSIGPGILSPDLPSIHPSLPTLGMGGGTCGFSRQAVFFVLKELPALTSDYRRNALSKVWSVSLHPWALTFHAICLSQRMRTRVGGGSMDRRYKRLHGARRKIGRQSQMASQPCLPTGTRLRKWKSTSAISRMWRFAPISELSPVCICLRRTVSKMQVS